MSLGVEQLHRIAEIVAEEIYREIGSFDACILGSALLMRLFEPLVDEVSPLPVELKLCNERYMQLAKDRDINTVSAAEALEWKEAGAQIVAIGLLYEDGSAGPFGKNADKGRYNGHVVAIVDRKYLIDVTIQQADRPAKGIHVQPVVTEIPERGFLHGSIPLVLTLTDEAHPQEPTTLVYLAHPGDRSYRQTADWESNRGHPRTDRILQRIRERVHADVGLEPSVKGSGV